MTNLPLSLYRVSSFAELQSFIVQHAPKMVEHVEKRRYRPELDGVLVSCRIERLRWGQQICSHSAPLGRKTNWGGVNRNIPTEYPGWIGRIELLFSNEAFGLSGCLSRMGICLGTGGGGHRNNGVYAISHEVILWGADFPNLVPRKSEQVISSQRSTVASIAHELAMFDERSLGERLDRWDILREGLSFLHIHGGAGSTPYLRRVEDREHIYLDAITRAYGAEWPYNVHGADYVFKQRHRHEVVELAGFGLLTKNIDILIEEKMKGEFIEIFDLTKIAKDRQIDFA